MLERCVVKNNIENDIQILAATNKERLGEKDRVIVEKSNAILNKCRARASERSKNKVALIQPRKGGRPSLGLLYIGAYLLDNNFEVKVFEFLDELYPPNIRYNSSIWKKLREFNPDIIGFNVISSTNRIVQRFIGHVRENLDDKIIICGGKHITSNPEDLLNAGADYCTIGEAEVTIIELLDALNFNQDIAGVRGIAYIKDGKIYNTSQRPFLPLDYILRPAFELVDYEKYVNFRFQGIPGHFLRTGFIFGSRGCPYRCEFCTTQIRGSYRERSIDNLIDEIQWQMNKYKVEAFVILDDIFYFQESRVNEFCQKIMGKNIKIKFFCHARVDRVQKETIDSLKKAGALLLAVGVESGSQKILDAFRKGTTVGQIESAFKIYNEIGIDTFAFIIVGHPDETEEDRNLTRELLKRIKPAFVPVSYYMPMPGTPSYSFDIKKARYLLGGEDFKDFTYTTDYPEISTTVPLEELKKIGDEFENLSTKNRNKNLFIYSSFIFFIIKFVIFHPGVIIEGLYLRYIVHKTNQMSLLAVLKDTIQFYMQKFEKNTL